LSKWISWFWSPCFHAEYQQQAATEFDRDGEAEAEGGERQAARRDIADGGGRRRKLAERAEEENSGHQYAAGGRQEGDGVVICGFHGASFHQGCFGFAVSRRHGVNLRPPGSIGEAYINRLLPSMK
jgi:hypothetical protein